MAIRIYNTLSGRKEDFTPLEAGKVSMYVCGPTVYDYSHLGHARSVVVFDVVARYLERSYDVTYVRNFTDVDDKIIRRANEISENPAQLAQRFIEAFHKDMDALGVRRPQHEPRVTDYIQHIVALIERLIEKGYAYRVDGDVFFRVEAYDGYGRLSGRRLEDMEAGARVDVNTKKQHPMDFALWKAAKPREPAWDSPWGKGRPGWHIECSAMSSALLGQRFDIHGGGKDLIFPHHENEIAQSEGASGVPYVNYWMHNGFVNIDQEKMSKSLGNFLTIREVSERYHPEVIRLFLLSSHYRSPLDFNEKTLQDATGRLERVYTFLARIDELAPDEGGGAAQPTDDLYWQKFVQAMDDDFNTALGLASVFEMIRSVNNRLDQLPGEALTGEVREVIARSRWVIGEIGRTLGLFQLPPAAYFDAKRQAQQRRHEVDAQQVEALIEQRNAARQDKDWATADRIRDQLKTMKVVLEDRPDGTRWHVETD